MKPTSTFVLDVRPAAGSVRARIDGQFGPELSARPGYADVRETVFTSLRGMALTTLTGEDGLPSALQMRVSGGPGFFSNGLADSAFPLVVPNTLIESTVVRDFQIGWAPDAWDELTKALRLDKDLAEGTGLARENRRGRLNDHFRSRILFPIYDDRGDPISFGGRILPGGEGPGNQGKYKNTTETPLYNKSKVLYGLDRSKTSIVTAGTAVICEGYTDVIGFHRAGVPLAVATCGTALTDDHVRLLTRFAARLYEG